ncbi:MAG TPA: SRPBCC family protein [Gemmatimonadales bacterium]
MSTAGTLQITAKGDRELVITRRFDAPCTLVFAALTKPELVKRWLGVFGGWSLAVCEIDLRVGGAYRYEWHGPKGARMGMRGVTREVTPPARWVATGRFDEAWYPGEEINTSVLVEQRGQTTLTNTVRYESQEARDMVLKSPMEKGMAAGYDNLEKVLATMAQEG